MKKKVLDVFTNHFNKCIYEYQNKINCENFILQNDFLHNHTVYIWYQVVSLQINVVDICDQLHPEDYCKLCDLKYSSMQNLILRFNHNCDASSDCNRISKSNASGTSKTKCNRSETFNPCGLSWIC